jgi:precorrin-6Y C5,15-methyltransferase (decarboxylating)
VIVVVGIGADGMAGLSDASRRELRSATAIYGSQRQLDLLDDSVAAPRHRWLSPMLPALETLLHDAPPGDIHVVASGDPLLHGIGATLIRIHGAQRVRVLPHVSSVTLACARMGWASQDTEVISLVTAPVPTAVRRGGQAVVLSRDAGTPAALAAAHAETGLDERRQENQNGYRDDLEKRERHVKFVAMEWSPWPPSRDCCLREPSVRRPQAAKVGMGGM